MKLNSTLLISLLSATLATTACLDVDDPEVGDDSLEGIYRQGIYRQGIYRQGIYRQGVDAVGVSGTGEFDGTVNGWQLRSSLRMYRASLKDARIERSELKAERYGVTLRGTQLAGARWSSNGVTFRIANARTDIYSNTMTTASSNSDSWEYVIKWWSSADRKWLPVCGEGPEGGRWATLVNGRWDESAAHIADTNITIGCSAGTIHKCAHRWGYKPWKSLWTKATVTSTKSLTSTKLSGSTISSSYRRVSLAPLHDACVFAASAVLCDDGQAHTTPGTWVDMVDVYGFNKQTSQADLEAAGAATGGLSKFVDESWYDQDGVVAANYERYGVYFGDEAPSGSTMDLGACSVPRSTSGDADGWLIKIRSDKSQWPEFDPDLPDFGTTPIETQGTGG